MAIPITIDSKDHKTEETVTIYCPFDHSIVDSVYVADRTIIDHAFSVAKMACPTIRHISYADIRTIFQSVRSLLANRRSEFATCIALEAGKPIDLAYIEVDRGLTVLDDAIGWTFHAHTDFFMTDAVQAGERSWSFSKREPYGVLLAITPFNFPLNLVLHKVLPALLGKNTVIVKPAPQTPITAIKLAQIFHEAGLPSGLLTVLPTADHSLSYLSQHPSIDFISFTGSTPVGQRLQTYHPTRPVLIECGGTAPMIIHDCRELETAVDAAIFGAFGYAGQTCISVQTLCCHADQYDAFIALFLEKMASLMPEHPLTEHAILSSVISRSHTDRLMAIIQREVESGSELMWGGTHNATCVRPTLLTAQSLRHEWIQAEWFGPIVACSPFESLDDIICMLNQSPYGLQASMFTDHLSTAHDAIHKLQYGSILINHSPTVRFDHLPYGGIKQSGNTKEGIRSAWYQMTWEKLSIVRALN